VLSDVLKILKVIRRGYKLDGEKIWKKGRNSYKRKKGMITITPRNIVFID
jgi:hypothetical protein